MRLPIVALTANALVGDADICREAGMDDHLAKPYPRNQLGALMARWLPSHLVEGSVDGLRTHPAPLAAEAAPPQPAPADTEGAVDAKALAAIREIDDADGSILAEVIGIFLDEAPQHLDALRTALRKLDGAELARAAHAFKSASGNVGAARVTKLCREIEHTGRSGKVSDAVTLVQQIEQQVDVVRPLLRDQIGQTA